jgi:uncharacterized protein (DUF362 family)/ferredoxin
LEKVYLGPCADYRVSEIRDFIQKGLAALEFEVRDATVLLKPNLLSGKSPEKAITTHPAMIQAIAELLLDKGCKVSIGDSPGYESAERALKLSGLMGVVEADGLKIARFDKRIVRKWEGISPYKVFTLGEDPRSYDVIINLPKLKTHGMMGLTLGVKNTFGFIPGTEKGKWHLRAGKDRSLFASVLVDIHNMVKPALTILDGIIGMDGEGPSSGRVRPFGMIALSRSAYALDRVIEERAGLSSFLPISRLAKMHGLLGDYAIVDTGAPVMEGFLAAHESDTDGAFPGFVKRVLRKCFVKKPKVVRGVCKGCGLCARVCPATAIVMENGLPRFNYKVCILCYCCQEMCPEGSIKVAR